MGMKRIAVLTGGGDCPGLNAVIRAVYKTAQSYGITVYGVRNGFRGLVEADVFLLGPEHISGILPRGGTVLGTTNRDNPFHYPALEAGQVVYKDVSQTVIANLHKYEIEALVVIGGDGTLNIAGEIADLGMPIVGVPKTIDNDIAYTERTFGFDSAVSVATDALDRLHTTAESHHRVMILESMGRWVGHIALHSGIGGGADCILIPEIPFKWESIINKIQARQQAGKNFSIIVVAEGAKPFDGEITVARVIEGSPEKIRLGGVGERIAKEIEQRTAIECRTTVLGHLQRGGSPTPYDRILATRYGEAAVTTLVQKKVNKMVALQNDRIIAVDLKDVVGKPNPVAVDHQLVLTGRALDICFGD
jgi:6-phosphofructokinase 1